MRGAAHPRPHRLTRPGRAGDDILAHRPRAVPGGLDPPPGGAAVATPVAQPADAGQVGTVTPGRPVQGPAARDGRAPGPGAVPVDGGQDARCLLYTSDVYKRQVQGPAARDGRAPGPGAVPVDGGQDARARRRPSRRLRVRTPGSDALAGPARASVFAPEEPGDRLVRGPELLMTGRGRLRHGLPRPGRRRHEGRHRQGDPHRRSRSAQPDHFIPFRKHCSSRAFWHAAPDVIRIGPHPFRVRTRGRRGRRFSAFRARGTNSMYTNECVRTCVRPGHDAGTRGVDHGSARNRREEKRP